MAKVARSLISEAKDGLTDEMFFTSKTMIEHFEKIIEGVTKTYHKKLKIIVIRLKIVLIAMELFIKSIKKKL